MVEQSALVTTDRQIRHLINNRLTTIAGTLELLLIAEGLDASLRQLVSGAVNATADVTVAVERLSSMLHDSADLHGLPLPFA
ncbi:MAG: hypothetical protein U0556_02775 [Dehalococcoidia bacterium]